MEKRLDAICEFLNIQDHFIDVGTDHAYIPIKMAKKGSSQILATDIHPKALLQAKKNILKENLEHQINTMITDGLENIVTENYDTLVIAGMGTATMIHILENEEKLQSIKKIILQSNNHLEELRMFMNQKKWSLQKEKIVYDKGHYYTIMEYIKGIQKLTQEELFLGIFDSKNEKYYQFLEKKYQEIYQKIPDTQPIEKETVANKLEWIRKYLQKENRII